MDGGVREELARALYEDHLNRAAARGVVDPAWSSLTDDEREAAREAADGLIDALEENGFELLPLRHWGAPTVAFTPTRRGGSRNATTTGGGPGAARTAGGTATFAMLARR